MVCCEAVKISSYMKDLVSLSKIAVFSPKLISLYKGSIQICQSILAP